MVSRRATVDRSDMVIATTLEGNEAVRSVGRVWRIEEEFDKR